MVHEKATSIKKDILATIWQSFEQFYKEFACIIIHA